MSGVLRRALMIIYKAITTDMVQGWIKVDQFFDRTTSLGEQLGEDYT